MTGVHRMLAPVRKAATFFDASNCKYMFIIQQFPAWRSIKGRIAAGNQLEPKMRCAPVKKLRTKSIL